MTLSMTYHNSVENLARYQRLRRLWIFLAILVTGMFLMSVRSRWDDIGAEQVGHLGTSIIWIGILGRLWSILYIGGHKAQAIITEGPYSVMRNPLYFFSTIAAFGVGMQTGTVTAGVLFGVMCFIAFQIVIRREESYLLAAFGKTYADYVASVPRFFPKPSLFHESGTRMFSTSRLRSTLLDGLVFLVAFPLFEIAEYLQEIGMIPVLLRLY
jgi:protein-S-isoprenylcysteine O-methyltransferase Ste14